MGVKTLWAVLSGSGEMFDLRELQGSSVAIDLAGWIVQNNTCKGMAGNVSRPHLRNLFFRTATLINLNIRPIFVLDGKAPDLKKETLEARRKAQTQSQDVEVKNFSRSRLKGLMNECKALLDSLGIATIAAEGEAESLCAKLNAEGVVDAVISDDSDAFCYGAKVLLRNFSISSGNGAFVEKYVIDKIEQNYKLDRNRLIAMAILLGCDFCPNGVPGVGKETVLQLFEAWPESWNAIGALRFWIKFKFQASKNVTTHKSKISYACLTCDGDSNHCDGCEQWSFAVESWAHCHCQLLSDNKVVLKLEESLKKKCAELGEFWNETFEKVLDEFTKTCKKSVIDNVRHFQMNCPNVDDFIKICVKKMAWTEEYATEKILPLISRWQVRNSSEKVVEPVAVVKKRTVSGTPSFNVSWTWVGSKPSLAPDTFETCEPAIYLTEFCPQLVEEFESKKKKPKVTKKKPKEASASQKITNFFKEGKKSKNKAVERIKEQEASPEMSEDEQLPDNLSFLIEDVLSHKMKRNLSLDKENVMVTSTPRGGPCPLKKANQTEKLIPPKIVCLEESLEDSFDRMCNVKGAFCKDF